MGSAKVALIYGSYSGEVDVNCTNDDEPEYIIAKAFRQAECNFLPMCSRSGKIISREYD